MEKDLSLSGGWGGKRRDWFAVRRDHFVRQAIGNYFCFVQSFHQLYEEYLHCRHPGGAGSDIDILAAGTGERRQKMWDQLAMMIGSETDKGRLWELKDLCHSIWPENDRQYNVHGALLDWLLGSIFHEAMKLKENIYLINTYGPAARRIRGLTPSSPDCSPAAASSLSRLSSMVDVELLIGRIAVEVGRQMERIGVLTGQATCILRLMMPELAGNPLVVRLLVEEEEAVAALWGEETTAVLADMFGGSAARGFCIAGDSYFAGQWYRQAIAMYRRSLVCDDACEKARQKIEEIKAMPELDREPQRVAAVNRPLVCEHRQRSNLDAGGFYRSL